jgi:hypothetical protein
MGIQRAPGYVVGGVDDYLNVKFSISYPKDLSGVGFVGEARMDLPPFADGTTAATALARLNADLPASGAVPPSPSASNSVASSLKLQDDNGAFGSGPGKWTCNIGITWDAWLRANDCNNPTTDPSSGCKYVSKPGNTVNLPFTPWYDMSCPAKKDPQQQPQTGALATPAPAPIVCSSTCAGISAQTVKDINSASLCVTAAPNSHVCDTQMGQVTKDQKWMVNRGDCKGCQGMPE